MKCPRDLDHGVKGRYIDIWLLHELRDEDIWPGINLE